MCQPKSCARPTQLNCEGCKLLEKILEYLGSGAMAGFDELVQEITAVAPNCLATATYFDGEEVLRARC
jgi:hypothetical protein